jgi:arylsulfatase A-like enzyme
MIACWPGKIKAGLRSGHVSSFWDVFPTCCELAGVKCPEGIDGISFMPTLLGQSNRQKKHEYLYWEFHERGKKQAVRFDDWKGVRLNVVKDHNGPIELYNLRDDIGEKNNLAEQHPNIVEKISGYMKTAWMRSEHWPLR